jgi:hypothetical protein
VLIGRFLTPHYTQSHLLRFLRARGWNIKAAAAMLLNDIEWRKDVGADNILETYPQSKYYQLLTGRLLVSQPLGSVLTICVCRVLAWHDARD